MVQPTDQPPPSDAPTHPTAQRYAEAVIEEFDQELRNAKLSRRRPMAKKQVWGAQPLWVVGVSLVLTAGLLLRGDDRWIVLGIGALILAIETGVWHLVDAKRGLVEVILSGAVALTAIARLAESVDRTFTVNHVYLVLALVGSLLLLVEGFKRGQPGSDTDR
jgi:hypothetical protein